MHNYKKIILNNGIPLYLYSDKSMRQVFVSYIIKYGSSGRWYNFELNGKKYSVDSGYAHYLEHLLGEHSKHGNIYTRFDKRLYDANAYTSYDHTCYHFCGINDIKKSIKELIEAIECPIFDDKDVNASRNAICEEASTSQDNVDNKLVNLVEKNLYSSYDEYDHTLSTIGNRKTTNLITTQGLYDCYNAFYNDDNKILVIAGNVNEKEIVDYLNEIYSKIPKHKNSVIVPQYDLAPIRRKYGELRRRIDTEIDCLGIKIKKPENVSKEELNVCIVYLIDYLLNSENEFYNYLKRNNLLDMVYYCYTKWHQDYIEFIHSFISNNPSEYYKASRDKLEKRDMKHSEFELMRKSFIAYELRNLDEKYKRQEEFGGRLPFTDNYSDLDVYINLTYDRFIEIINQLDFGKYTMGKVRRLTK